MRLGLSGLGKGGEGIGKEFMELGGSNGNRKFLPNFLPIQKL